MLLTLKQISHTLLLPTFKNHGNLSLSVPPQCHPPLQMRPCARLLTTTFVRDTHPFFRIRKKSLHVENKPKPQRERIVSQPPFFIPNHHFSEAGCCYPSSNLSKLTCNWEFVGLQMFKQFHLSLPNFKWSSHFTFPETNVKSPLEDDPFEISEGTSHLFR